MSPLDKLVEELLNRLEQQEYVSLQWGFINGAFTPDEIERCAEETLAALPNLASQAGDPEAADLKDVLTNRRLLFRSRRSQGDATYRTRFAETIRLMAQLRQLFLRRDNDPIDVWRSRPLLVSDYRLIRKPRIYPHRYISGNALVTHLEDERLLSLPPALQDALLTITGGKELADFQRDATARILATRYQTEVRGTIVCAGTGTGKTLAFYLPCFSALIADLQPGVHATACLALYPRNELLKDQFQAATANAILLKDIGTRPLCLAVYNGSTPKDAGAVAGKDSWRRFPRSGFILGYICPFLRCPDCNGDLIWRCTDIDTKTESLYCDGCTSVKTTSDTVRLTRGSIESSPPDVLFTTTEMLNRSLSNRKRHPMIGIGNNSLKYVLLDEAHTYEGVTGAQNALLLRRWKHLRRTGRQQNAAVHFVGLSATLLNPRRFFADLIGEAESHVEAITVGGNQDTIGWEFQLALRGNPAETASLLSTTIQTVMLLSRMLDPLGGRLSDGVYPGKVFAFTDDLDVTNRLYFNLIDAEGGSNGQRPPLAHERRPLDDNGNPWPDMISRERMGQVWRNCENIGNLLVQRLPIDRVSSQDSGVNPNAKVIVATSSLEVGYDDDQVGAVVQHKAARGAASFVQRKGRAGRNRNAHPWTVVVLSDFGRDRIAYQGYDQLFEPELDRSDLPVHNRYVVKMQATFALMDYLQQRIDRRYSDVWNALAYQVELGTPYTDWSQKRQQAVRQVAEAILIDDGERERFSTYLQQSLILSEEEAHAALWLPPRALMTSVLPTVVRRMDANFAGERGVRRPTNGASQDTDDEGTQYQNPLPEFVTSNLFSNLLTPEVKVIARGPNDAEETTEELGVIQALTQTSPGRVSRRYAVQHETQEHWIPPGFGADGRADISTTLPNTRELSLDSFFSGLPVGHALLQSGEQAGDYYEEAQDARYYDADGAVRPVVVYRPVEINVRRANSRLPDRWQVVNTSRTMLTWKSQFHVISGDDSTMQVLSSIPLSVWIPRVHFCTYASGNPLCLQRFAVGCEGTITVRQMTGANFFGPSQTVPIRVRFTENPQNAGDGSDTGPTPAGGDAPTPLATAGIGFQMEADAIAFQCRFSEELLNDVLAESLTELRVPRFYHEVRTIADLNQYNIFQRDWFCQVGLSVFTATAERRGRSLAEAIQSYDPAIGTETAASWRRGVEFALQAIFQLRNTSDATQNAGAADGQDDLADYDDSDSHGPGGGMPARYGELLQALTDTNAVVRTALVRAARFLHNAPDDTWKPWLRNRLRATLGGALLQTCNEVASEYQTAELQLDIDTGPPTDSDLLSLEDQNEVIWISESIPGSAGVIEQVRRTFLFEQERFFTLVENALHASRWDALARQLRKVLDLQAEDGDVALSLDAVRAAVGIHALGEARDKLFDILKTHEINLSHAMVNAINVRILHPASSPETDTLLRELMLYWDSAEERLGLTIDSRVFAYLAASHALIRERVERFLRGVSPGEQPSPSRCFSAVYAMLWPRGYSIRERAFDTYNPFASLPSSDPLLLKRLTSSWNTGASLAGTSDVVVDQIVGELRGTGRAKLVNPIAAREEVKNLLLRLAATPIETGFLIGYPRIGQTEMSDTEISVSLTLPEAFVL